MAVGRRHGQRRGNCVYPRDRTRHAVHFVASGLCAGMHVLLHRAAGLQPQPYCCRNHRPALVGEQGIGRDAEKRACDFQRRDDGHGRTDGQLRQCGHRTVHYAGRPRLRFEPPPRNRVHIGHGAADGQAERRYARCVGGVAARLQRQSAGRNRAAEQKISA